MAHVRTGDTVMVIAGKEKGKTGKVMRILTKKDRVVVEGLMKVKRHTKPSQKNPQGGIVEREGSIHLSNVALWNSVEKRIIKAGSKLVEGKKIRIDKKTGDAIPDPGMTSAQAPE
jgi:large subunit ribosomal protein L24